MYAAKTFEFQNFDALPGMDMSIINRHLGLYYKYVDRTNEWLSRSPADKMQLAADASRSPFDFNGMRLHEIYFEQLYPGGISNPFEQPYLMEAIDGDVEGWMQSMVDLTKIPGPGWATFGKDMDEGRFLMTRINSHEIGPLISLGNIFVIDGWEHAYLPGTMDEYLEGFFKNINWPLINERIASVAGIP
jgi:Fe-Mn family superoxide dismutase